MSATHNTWKPIGLAVRERDAIRLEILDGEAAGAYFIAAADVAAVLDLGIVPVYQIRPRAGEEVPVECGHVRTSTSGRMIVCQLDGPHAIVMAPRVALLDHFNEGHGRSTRIVIPPDPTTGPARASPVAVSA